jgi:hypothetical protein
MKNIIIIILFVIISENLYSQRWEVILGEPYRRDYSLDVTEDYDKGYLISGGYESTACWLMKTDINGNLLWEKYFEDETYSNVFFTVVPDNEGNIYLFGWRVIDFVSGWPAVVKLDECGEMLWCKQFVDDQFWYGWFQDAILTESGDIIGLAHMESQEQIDQIFLYYINQDGDLLWKKSYASKNDHPLFAARDGKRIYRFEDKYLIAGHCYYPYPNNPYHVFLHPLFIMIDSLFQEQWVLPYGVSDSLLGKAYATAQITDSVFMGVGTCRFVDNGELINNSFLMFFNNNGDELGHRIISNESIDTSIRSNFIEDIERINDTLFLTSSNFGDLYEGNPYGEFVIDTSGNVYLNQQRPNTGIFGNLIRTFDSKYIVAASIKESKTNWDIYLYKINENLESDTLYPGIYLYDSLCSKPIQSGIIDLSDCEITTYIEDTPSPEDYYDLLLTISVKAYPIPARDYITFSYKNTEYHQNIKLQCFDVLSRKVHEEKIYCYQDVSRVDISGWNEGIYVAIVRSDGQVVGKARFIISY